MSWRDTAWPQRRSKWKPADYCAFHELGITFFRALNLDSIQLQAENMRMRRAHKLALILGVLLGLFGQIVTVAASPVVATAISAAAPETMPMDCVGMMQGDGEKSLPCQQMTLACLAGMGCFPLFAVNSRSPSVTEMVSADLLLISPSYSELQGRSSQPEQHPPNTSA